MKRTILAISFLSMVFIGLAAGCSSNLPELPDVPDPSFPRSLEEPSWSDVSIESVCLDVAYDYQALDPVVHPEDAIRQLLTGIGINVVNAGSACDASLTVELSAETVRESYLGLGICIVGEKVTGLVTLARGEKEPLQVEIDEREADAPGSMLSTQCRRGDQYRVTLWKKPVLSILNLLWGSEIIAAGLDEPTWDAVLSDHLGYLRSSDISEELLPFILWRLSTQNEDDLEAALRGIMAVGYPAKDAIPFLIDALMRKDVQYGGEVSHDFVLRSHIIAALGEIGPAAVEAVPYMYPHLDVEEIEGIHHQEPKDIHSLRRITGEFYETGAAYETWYEENRESWPAVVQGKVIRSDTNQPVPFVDVGLFSRSVLPEARISGRNVPAQEVDHVTFTDAEGAYQIEALPGDYFLYVEIRVDPEEEGLCEFLPGDDWTRYDHGDQECHFFIDRFSSGLRPVYSMSTEVTLTAGEPQTLDVDIICRPEK